MNRGPAFAIHHQQPVIEVAQHQLTPLGGALQFILIEALFRHFPGDPEIQFARQRGGDQVVNAQGAVGLRDGHLSAKISGGQQRAEIFLIKTGFGHDFREGAPQQIGAPPAPQLTEAVIDLHQLHLAVGEKHQVAGFAKGVEETFFRGSRARAAQAGHAMQNAAQTGARSQPLRSRFDFSGERFAQARDNRHGQPDACEGNQPGQERLQELRAEC